MSIQAGALFTLDRRADRSSGDPAGPPPLDLREQLAGWQVGGGNRRLHLAQIHVEWLIANIANQSVRKPTIEAIAGLSRRGFLSGVGVAACGMSGIFGAVSRLLQEAEVDAVVERLGERFLVHNVSDVIEAFLKAGRREMITYYSNFPPMTIQRELEGKRSSQKDL